MHDDMHCSVVIGIRLVDIDAQIVQLANNLEMLYWSKKQNVLSQILFPSLSYIAIALVL